MSDKSKGTGVIDNMASIARRSRSRFSAVRHKSVIRLCAGAMPYYVVNEFPKSGGSWLAQMLAEALKLPFRRNESVRLERSIVQGHFLNPAGLRRVVVIWRDPRDVLVSYYYHCYFVNEHHNDVMVNMMKQRLPFKDYENIRDNLPAFIHFVSTTPASPRFTWPQFVDAWASRSGVVQTHYGALRCDASGELARIVRELTGQSILSEAAKAIADRHSFERVKRQAQENMTKGVEKSFVREGAIGGWQRHFSQAALDEFDRYYLRSSRKLGYK